MIQEDSISMRIGIPAKGTYDELADISMSFAGGNGLNSLKIGDSVICNEDSFELRVKMVDGIERQTPIFRLSNCQRVITVATIVRKDFCGEFHPQSLGMDYLLNCEAAREVILALKDKTIEVIGVRDILLPSFKNKDEMVSMKQYAWKIS